MDSLDAHACVALVVSGLGVIFHPIRFRDALPIYPHAVVGVCASFVARLFIFSIETGSAAAGGYTVGSDTSLALSIAAGFVAGLASVCGLGTVAALVCVAMAGSHYTGRTILDPVEAGHVGLVAGLFALAVAALALFVFRLLKKTADVVLMSASVVATATAASVCLINGGVAASASDQHLQSLADPILWNVGICVSIVHVLAVGRAVVDERTRGERSRSVKRVESEIRV